MRLGVSAALVDGTLIDGDVTIDGDSVTAVGVSGAGGRGVAVPGFVDAHINGIAGVDFLTADADGHARAGEALAAAGVVAYQPTLVSSPPEAYDAPLAAAAAAMAAPGGGSARAGRSPRGTVPVRGVARGARPGEPARARRGAGRQAVRGRARDDGDPCA